MTRRAFTLIELIIAAAILSVVMVSVYSAFSVGIKAWRTGSEGQDLRKTRIALLKIQKELRSSFFFSKAPFKGGSSEIIFPIAVTEKDTKKIHIVTYSISEDKKYIIRKQRLFTENSQAEEEAVEKRIFSARSIAFQYMYRLDNPEGIDWEGDWPETRQAVPSAVKISFELDNGNELYNKTIFIPQGALTAR